MDTYICNIDIIIYYNRQYCIGTYLYFLSLDFNHSVLVPLHIRSLPYTPYTLLIIPIKIYHQYIIQYGISDHL